MRGKAGRDVRDALDSVRALLPLPWDIDVFVQRLGVARDRQIDLVPWTFEGAGGPSGIFIPSAAADYVFFDAAASPGRREQIIGHELGHLLLGHSPLLQDPPMACSRH